MTGEGWDGSEESTLILLDLTQNSGRDHFCDSLQTHLLPIPGGRLCKIIEKPWSGRRVMANQNERTLFWHSFIYDVNRATASLLYLLQGMESVREKELPPYDQLPSEIQYSFPNFAKPPGIVVPLALGGKSFNPHEILDLGGEAEQLAYKGWVVQVYDQIWEANYRNHFKDGYEGDDLIRPLSQPFGDFGYIRNDLVHNKGVAKDTGTGRCEILRWFEPGERMILGMHHVFDFLNQAGFMVPVGGFVPGGGHAAWTSLHLQESDFKRGTTPTLVSCRGSLGEMDEDGTAYYVISLVFENGVYFCLAIHDVTTSKSSSEWYTFVSKIRIDEDGRLRFPDGEVRDCESLYAQGVDDFLNHGIRPGGAPQYGPWFRFRKQD